ncbi:bcl-2-binding component 3 isoform X2 [Lates calcarifer]|uniref:Bcl-2-binding component 3 isoform X2 n=1 Tax=Lates calcarifer TaxID=8187 RepID=A0AAJ7LE52_LATCA|nr:bcl-2-binding component 3 isoform X2 [Lates calcarifer]
MARAETIESVGETGGGGNGPLPGHNTCRMELPRPFHSWPGLLTTTTITTGSGAGTGAIHLHHNHHHHLHPLQSLYLSYPLPDETQTHQQLPALPPSPAPPPSPLCNQREVRGGGAETPSAFSGEESDSDREEHQETSRRRGPLPDLLPQNEHPSWASPHHRAPRREAVQELQVRRVASQLRAIGDEFNATVLHRVHIAPHWQNWRDACRGLLNFITQTLSTLYRLT